MARRDCAPLVHRAGDLIDNLLGAFLLHPEHRRDRNGQIYDLGVVRL
jgi:hypothetical protein